MPVLLPPPLEKLYNTPVLRSEIPAGFHQAKVVRLAPDPRYHSLGAVRIDFSNAQSFESASYALFHSAAKASALAKKERAVNSGGFFHVQVRVIGRLVVAATAKTRTKTITLLSLAIHHLRRSES